jgi:hypothetical protein
MGRLVKMFGDQLVIAENFVHAPGYSLYVSDAPADHDGWKYYSDNVEHTDFVLPWVQPTDATNAYKMGSVVSYNGSNWRSLLDANVWVPGVSGWVSITAGVPVWIQPTGAFDAYAKDVVVSYNNKLWRSLVNANVWVPGVANWRESILTPPGATPTYPEWVQPTGAGDAYALNAMVSHNGHVWKSSYASNVWEPGVFGWVQQ